MKKLENLGFPIVRQLDNVFLIDWLSIVFHGVTYFDLIEAMDLTDCPWDTDRKFINGYPMQTSFSHINIRWGADEAMFYQDGYDRSGRFKTAAERVRTDMGIQLELSGQGCRAFEEFSTISWLDLFDRFKRLGCEFRVTRLDLAYDDHSGLLNIWQMKADVEARNYISKSKKSIVIRSDDQLLDVIGLTLQIGSKASPGLIRIYDKAAERGFGSEKHWIRVELQLRDDRSDEAFKKLCAGGSVGELASGVIRNYCQFVVPTSDSNKSRWPEADYWTRCLDGMGKIRVWVAPGEPYNFSKAEQHFVFQYGQFLRCYELIHGSLSDLSYAALKTTDKLKPKYRAAVQSAKILDMQRKAEIKSLRDQFGFDSPDEFLKQIELSEYLVDCDDLPEGW